MSNCNEIAEVLKRNGLDQAMRYDRALDPENLKLMGFGLEDWLKFAYNFAKDVNYFNEQDDTTADGDWQDFFPDFTTIKTLLDDLESSDKLTPHLALFVCFLQLIEQSTNRLNDFTRRHLDFYYAEVLQLEHLSEQPDSVNVIFELARAFVQEKIAAGTELDADKDLTDKTRVYALKDEVVFSQAKVGAVKTVYNAPNAPVNGSYALRSASEASTYDGAGAAFPGDDTTWYPFGYAGTPDSRPQQAQARVGFAVASHTLELSEGLRQVVIQASFSGALPTLTAASNDPSLVSVYYTGPKGWVGPLSPSTGTITIDENTGAPQNYTGGLNGQLLTVCMELQPEQEAVVNYDAALHGGNYTTTDPLFRFEVATDQLGGYDVYRLLSQPITDIKVKVNVKNMRALIIENDTGSLNVKKPFYAFTPNPVKGSAFSIFHEEVFSKKWKHIDVNIHWKNTPDDFRVYYEGYDQSFLGTITQEWINTRVPYTQQQQQQQQQSQSNMMMINASNTEQVQQMQMVEMELFRDYYTNIVTGNNYFKASSWIYSNGSWNDPLQTNIELFVPDGSNPVAFETDFSVNNNSFAADASGPIRLTLNQSFLQEIYPRIYSLAMMSTNPNVPIPNQPYIPFADAITLNYSATDELNLFPQSEQTFDGRTVQLFHLHPFGESEENAFLKTSYDGQTPVCSLTPVYCKGGELYIGLENAAQLQQVSLLIQVLEGSENPLAESFSGSQKVHWAILCDNNWKTLDSSLLLVNETDNFLQSGLVKFKIPIEATSDNTLLPPGMFWVRAKMYKTDDAVCRMLGIFAQAATAVFDDRGNELSHLEKGIPAETISKLVSRLATVKSVKQPYNSFGGRSAESDAQYYKRVSERLRHKNRAINLWDYEHLVLQNFPEIYKVKCLTHTSDCSFQSPGNVTLVVIPDTLNRNVFDRYQPRVSKATLNRVDDFISELNSLHVKTHVINPDYQEVKVSTKVKFYPQFDEALYVDQLNEDITRFLSPWAFSGREEIDFGGKLHLSVLIDYIEELPYVDYLQDVRLFQDGAPVTSAEPTSPKAILVSAKRHEISTTINSCLTPNTATEQCQL